MSDNLKNHIVKDHLKRFTQKNKTVQLVREEKSPRAEMRKNTAPNSSFLHCNSQSYQEQTKEYNETKFYKDFLSVQSQYDSTIEKRKTSPVYTTSQSFYPYSTKISSPKTLFNQQSNQKPCRVTQFYTTSYHNLSSSKKKLYKINSDKFNSTSQLQIWKQLQKSYKKNQNLHNKIENQTKNKNNQISMKVKDFLDFRKRKATNQLINGHKMQDTENKIVKSFLQKYGKKDFNKGNKKQDQQQNDLESKMILGRSFSFDKFQKSRIKYNRNLIKKVTDNGKSPKFRDQSSILLLHKEPLESCIEQYFVPLKKEIHVKNQMEPPVKHEQIKIKSKSKKLTHRSIEHLQRIKKGLFKQRSQEEVSAKEFRTTLVSKGHSKDGESTAFLTSKVSQRQSAKQKKPPQSQTINSKSPSQRQSVKSKNLSQSQSVKSKQRQFSKKANVTINTIPLSQSMKRPVYLQKIPQLIHHNITSSTLDAPGMLSPSHLDTPKHPQITPTSSAISFGEDQLNDKLKQVEKSEPYFNAW